MTPAPGNVEGFTHVTADAYACCGQVCRTQQNRVGEGARGFILPPLLIALVILAYWIVPALQSNTEDGKQPTGGAHVRDPTNR